MSPRTPLALIGVVAVLALPACGEDEGGEGGPGEPLSAEEYERQAAAALDTIVNLDELSAPLANPESVEAYIAGVREITSEIEGAVADLVVIVPPEDVAATHDELIGAIEGYGAAFPPVADAAEAGDRQALQASAQDLQEAAVEFQETATRLGEQFEEAGIDLASLG